MAWRDTLRSLREELAEVRAERRRQAETDEAEVQRAREELSRLAGSLGIVQLLNEMNESLLEGRGDIETVVSWEAPAEGDDLAGNDVEEGEDDTDGIATILAWEEAGEREIAVDLGLGEQGIYLQVNGVDIRQETVALEHALVEAFRDELEL